MLNVRQGELVERHGNQPGMYSTCKTLILFGCVYFIAHVSPLTARSLFVTLFIVILLKSIEPVVVKFININLFWDHQFMARY